MTGLTERGEGAVSRWMVVEGGGGVLQAATAASLPDSFMLMRLLARAATTVPPALSDRGILGSVV